MSGKVNDSKKERNNHLTSTEDLVSEIQEYLGWDISRAVESLSKGTRMLAEEWNNLNPQTPEEIIDFYKKADHYIFDLAAWHRTPERRNRTLASISLCKQEGITSVLDFGCGIGQDGILFAESGFRVTLSDLPCKTFDFARWRVKKKGLSIKLVNSSELEEKYECILCFDVLEHIWDPREVIQYLKRHLSDRGILLVTVAFYHNEIHPMHLQKNEKYRGIEFYQLMTTLGFRWEPPWNRIPFVCRKK